MSASLLGQLRSPTIEPVEGSAVEPVVDSRVSGRRGRGAVVIGALVALLIIVGLALSLRGYRVYVMETPSMGTAAPVGALVATQPAGVDDLNIGDVVTVNPRAGGTTHTHRVVALAHGLATTQGDLNGTPDPEVVNDENLVGRAVMIMPVMGWVVKMLPITLMTTLVGYLLTHWMRDPQARFRNRVLGFFCGIALASVVVQPLMGVKLLSMNVDRNADGPFAEAYVVSTGLLPVRVAPLEEGGQESAVLAPTGTAGMAVATQPSADGQLAFYPQMTLTPAWWIGLALYCALPFAVFGLHEILTQRKRRWA